MDDELETYTVEGAAVLTTVEVVGVDVGDELGYARYACAHTVVVEGDGFAALDVGARSPVAHGVVPGGD